MMYLNKPKPKSAIIYFCGNCLPDSSCGIATYGFIIKEKKNVILKEKGVALEESGTCSIAEYTGLIKALERAIELGYSNVKIYGDSMFVINQLNSKSNIRSTNLFSLYKKTVNLLKKFNSWNIQWIEKNKNAESDKLSVEAFLECVENKNFQRTANISLNDVSQIDKNTFKVKGHIVSLTPMSCDCLYFTKINSFLLIRQKNILVKCKHILYVQKFYDIITKQFNKKPLSGVHTSL